MKHLVTITNLRLARSRNFKLELPRLRVGAGSFLCVAGPNGSGKSTLMECLSGLLKPAQGTITICGIVQSQTPSNTRRVIGYIPDDENWFIKELSAREYFALLRSTYWSAGVTIDMQERQAVLAAKLGFTAFDIPLQQLSHGNKKKVQIIAGLLHKPAVILIDEVRNGLDPLAIIAVEALLKEEVARGACVIAATHDLWWAERVASDILLLVEGQVAFQDHTEQLLKNYDSLQDAFITIVKGPK